VNGGDRFLENQINLDPNWLIAIGILMQAVVAIVLVSVVCSSKKIAKEQKDIANKQIEILGIQNNLALHERRFIIYESLMKLLGAILGNGTLTNEELTEFWIRSKEGSFILDDELNSYIQEIQTRCNTFVTLRQDEPRILGPEYDEWILILEKEKTYFLRAFDEIPKRFDKYLGFKQITYG
jgi:hypothetical protein